MSAKGSKPAAFSLKINFLSVFELSYSCACGYGGGYGVLESDMNKIYKYTDVIILVLTVIITVVFIGIQITYKSFMIDETLGVILFLFSMVFKILNFKIFQYVIFFLLIVLLLNVIKFDFTTIDGDVSTTYYSVRYTGFGFNPIILLILILF